MSCRSALLYLVHWSACFTDFKWWAFSAPYRLSGLLAGSTRAVALGLLGTFFRTALADGSCHGQEGLNGCSWGNVKGTFVACFSRADSLGRGCEWLYQHTSQLLQTQRHNMYE